MNTFCALAIAVILAPAPLPQSAAAKAQTDADMKELATYTMTVETMNKVDRAMRAVFVELKKDPRMQEAATIETEIKALQEKDEQTEAEQKRLDDLGARLESLESDATNMSDAQNISQMVAKIEKSPPVMTGLRSAGLTPREYSRFMLAALQAGLTAGLQKAGALKEIPAGTNPANVKFMMDHEEDFKRMQVAWGALGK